MRTILLQILLLIGLSNSSSAQVQREIHETFDAPPPYWSWANEYSDQNLRRSYSKGMLAFKVSNGNNYWTLAYRPIEARFDWSVSAVSIMDDSKTNEGLGLIVLSKGEFFIFKLAGGNRSIWVGKWVEKSNTWTTISAPGPNNSGDRFCACIKPNGTPNTMTVRGSRGRLQVVVNDSIV
ncbi:MAG: hypothetical protein NTX15_02360, partial [Candidatus Kapabacteria bacterium]|nr:hypothetical protein [Candidatus Kapabacteria bacterium]